ncbi:hypothetical protein ACNHUS_05895 [Actinomycetes bacterium M1A6_2h]
MSETEISEVGTEVDVDSPRPTRAKARILRRIALGTVVVTAAVVTTLSFMTMRNDDAADRSRAEVASTASDAAVAILSYRTDTVDADVEHAKSFLTGDFLDYYTTFGTQVVAPSSKERGITSSATVSGTSVVSATDGAAVALVFVNQNVTTTDLPTPTASSSSLRIELTRVGDAWMVSKLDPV